MKKLMNLFFALTVIILVALCVPTANANGDTVTVQMEVQYRQSDARNMLKMLNDFRANGDDELGKPWYWNSSNEKVFPQPKQLTYDYTLEAIAMQRAAEIAISLSHTRPDNSAWYTAPGFRQFPSRAENIAVGSLSAESAFIDLAEHDYSYCNQGHRRNMLSNYTAVGIAHIVYNDIHYWVQEFATPARNTTVTAANNSITVMDVTITGGSFDVYCAEDSIEMKVGTKTELPELYTTVITQNTWPGYPCPILGGEWKVKDSSVATIADGKLVAKASGKTTLIGTSYGKTIEVPVTVASAAKISTKLAYTCYAHTGSAIHPQLTVSDDSGKVLKENRDYTVQYRGNCTDAGEHTVIVNGKGNYSFKNEVKFEIVNAMKLPSAFSTIEAEAFSGLGIPMIIIPAGIDAIEDSAFAYCCNLKVVTFESNPSSIANNILAGCSNVTVRVTRGGTAEQWAKNMGYPVEYI